MNTLSFEFSLWVLVVSVILRVIAAVFYAIVAYKAYKEVGVKNGLVTLRRQLFTSSAILFLINTLGMFLLIIRSMVNADTFSKATNGLSILNSIGFFFVAFIFYKVYTQSYTEESKDRHAKIEVLEKKDKKTGIRREIARVKLNKDRREVTKVKNLKVKKVKKS